MAGTSQTQVALEREQSAQALESAQNQIAELQKKLDAKNEQLNVATAGDGVSPELTKDIARRMALGLPEHHARVAALAQQANDIAEAQKKQSP